VAALVPLVLGGEVHRHRRTGPGLLGAGAPGAGQGRRALCGAKAGHRPGQVQANSRVRACACAGLRFWSPPPPSPYSRFMGEVVDVVHGGPTPPGPGGPRVRGREAVAGARCGRSAYFVCGSIPAINPNFACLIDRGPWTPSCWSINEVSPHQPVSSCCITT
jgi:hypothetical protein